MIDCICKNRKKGARHTDPSCPQKTPPGQKRNHAVRITRDPAYRAVVEQRNARRRDALKHWPKTDELAAQVMRIVGLGVDTERRAAQVLERMLAACKECDGRGEVPTDFCASCEADSKWEQCPACAGSGKAPQPLELPAEALEVMHTSAVESPPPSAEFLKRARKYRGKP